VGLFLSAALERQPTNGEDVDEVLIAEADAALADAQPSGVPAAPPEPPASKETADMCAMLLQVTFNRLVAPRQGEHWKLADEECTALGAAYGAVLDKYFPDLRFGVEVTAIIVTLTVFGPRYLTSVDKADEQKQKQPAPAAAADVPTRALVVATD